MKKDLIVKLTNGFEGAARVADGVEYWMARDIQELLEYEKWENFLNVIEKAKSSCENSGHLSADHFADVRKMVLLGSGSNREIPDFMLSRYACYLIAQNGDPRKEPIAFAQSYFAIQTRKQELLEERNNSALPCGKLTCSFPCFKERVYGAKVCSILGRGDPPYCFGYMGVGRLFLGRRG